MSLDYQLLKGRRKKKLETCPNPLFMQWITEWIKDAAEKGLKSQHTYKKALDTMKKYPVKLTSGKECKLLTNFGDKICQMLDQKLQEYVAQYGTTEPVEGYLHISIGNQPKRKKKTVNSGYDDLNFDNLRVPPPETAVRANACLGADSGSEDERCGAVQPALPNRQRRNTGNRQPREYIPQYRSGPYALLLTLYKHNQRGGRHMSKQDLMQEAQPLADKSFSIPDPGSRYTAWSSMGSLINKGFITKESSPAKYVITIAGSELAARILEAERQGEFHMPANSVNDQLRFTLGNGPQPVLPNLGNAEPDFGAVVDSDDDVMAVDDPGVVYSVQGNIKAVEERSFHMESHGVEIGSDEEDDSCCGLQFHYINEAGSEVSHKDQASVTVNDEISVGFLIRCTYEDLLMSGKRYKLDTTRHTIGDDIFAYIADDDAPDISTKARQLIKTHKKLKLHTENNNVSTKIQNNFKTNTKSSDQSCSSTAPFYTGETRPRVAPNNTKYNSNNHDQMIDLDIGRPRSIADCKPKVKQSVNKVPSRTATATTTTTAAKCDSALGNQKPEDFSLPDLNFGSSHSLPSLSGDSQSQSSVSDVGGAKDSTSDNPEFILRPGQFDVILCVDNQEFYGGGTDNKKQMLVKELQRHQVPHEIRPLHIGDFCWVAKDKIGGRELVLDHIIERKRMDDLAGSIIDGRFKEQKFRLKNCGLRHPIYLVEDYGSNQHFSIGEDALFQAITNTQVIDNFYVKRTTDTKESAAYLTLMTRYLQSLHAQKTLCAVSKSQVDSSQDIDQMSNQEICLMKFDDFNQASIKTKAFTVREMFGKQLCQLQSLTAEKAAAILEQYPTPTRLMKAYRSCGTEKDKETLLSNIKFGVTQKNLGVALSKSIYFMYNTTEGAS